VWERSGTVRRGEASAPIAGTLSSLVGLVLFVVGVPVLLVSERASSPFTLVARVVGHPSSVFRSVEGPVTDSTVVHAVVLMAWLAWAWLVVCVLTEAAARLRGRPPARLPASRHAQSIVALLVGASLAVLPSARAYPPIRIGGVSGTGTSQTLALVGNPGVERLPAVSLVDSSSGSDCGQPEATIPGTARIASHGPGIPRASSAVSSSSSTASDTQPLYVVQPGDTLWSIAGRELGSPLLWRQIAALNIGRTQPDGFEMVDAGWILPGWVLRLPPTSTAGPRAPGPEVGVSGGRRNDQRITPARAAPESNSPVVRTTTESTSVPLEPSVDDHPKRNPGLANRTRSGRTSASSSESPETDSKVAAPARDGGPTASARTRSSDPQREGGGTGIASGSRRDSTGGRDPAGEGRSPSSPARDPGGVPYAPFGYGLLGAAVVIVINRLRRVQQRHRPTGLRIALPDEDLAGAERILRWSADLESAAWVDATLRILAAACRRSERRPPRVAALRVLPESTELVLSAESDGGPAPEPFQVHGARSSWTLPRTPDLLEEAQQDPWVAGIDVTSPGLVTLGRGVNDLLLIDVEQAGSIAIVADRADDVLRAMAIELATSSWSDQVNVVLRSMRSTAFAKPGTWWRCCPSFAMW